MADNQYQPIYKIPLIAGRNLFPSDTSKEFLVNETLIKNLGIKNPEEALNKDISLWNGFLKGPIVGVMKDFKLFVRDLWRRCDNNNIGCYGNVYCDFARFMYSTNATMR